MVFLDDSLVDKMAPLPRGVGRVKDGHVSFSALQVVQRIVQCMLTCQTDLFNFVAIFTIKFKIVISRFYKQRELLKTQF
jgi:hypothetical protein